MRKTEAFVLSLGFLSLPVSAEASVTQSISARDATTGTAPVINVCPITGFNLSFLEVKGGIVQAKLVDPSMVHLSFDSDIKKSPAKVAYLRRIDPLKFPGLPSATKNQPTTLSIRTTDRKLYRFKVAYACPSNTDTGIVRGAVASRPRRFSQRIQESEPVADPSTPKLEIEPPKPTPAPKPKVEKSEHPEPPNYHPELAFSNQYFVQADALSLYGISPDPVIPDPVNEELVQPQQEYSTPELEPVKTPIPVAAPKQVAVSTKTPHTLSPSKTAWYLTRGLHSANLRGEINYNTSTYRRWQRVISRVRRGKTFEVAVSEVGTQLSVGKVLLKYGGLNK